MLRHSVDHWYLRYQSQCAVNRERHSAANCASGGRSMAKHRDCLAVIGVITSMYITGCYHGNWLVTMVYKATPSNYESHGWFGGPRCTRATATCLIRLFDLFVWSHANVANVAHLPPGEHEEQLNQIHLIKETNLKTSLRCTFSCNVWSYSQVWLSSASGSPVVWVFFCRYHTYLFVVTRF